MELWEFVQKQSLPYEAKITLAKLRAREFYDKLDGNIFCTVCGWGDGINDVPEGALRAQAVFELLNGEVPMCFGTTLRGNPKHPLYLPGDAEVMEYQQQK